MSRAALSVASECVPLVKTGGLADVAGALPGALAGQGWRLRTLIPGYQPVLQRLRGRGEAVWQTADLFGGPARLIAAEAAGLDLLVLDAPHLYNRGGSIYLGPDGLDWPDNAERYAALSRAAAEVAAGALEGWRPEVVHLHDWQAALAAPYIRAQGSGGPGVLMTIHNVAFKGDMPAARRHALGLPEDGFTPEGYEFWGGICALKAGLVYADAISTVSPTYARELTTPAFGMGLEGVIAKRSDDLYGILNGIDTRIWSPSGDVHAPRFSRPAGKAKARRALAEEFGLTPGDGPLCVVISRLTAQKGIDLALAALPRLLAAGGSLAVLGSGEAWLEQALLAAARGSDRVGVRIGYDEGLSHRMFAGGDAVLVPSRFEPCGLTQMYGLRYGAIPVVARTGGLADTVIDANDAGLRAGAATGLMHAPGDAGALGAALERLCALHARPEVWARMQRNAMKHPVGWEEAAADYAALYARLAERAA